MVVRRFFYSSVADPVKFSNSALWVFGRPYILDRYFFLSLLCGLFGGIGAIFQPNDHIQYLRRLFPLVLTDCFATATHPSPTQNIKPIVWNKPFWMARRIDS